MEWLSLFLWAEVGGLALACVAFVWVIIPHSESSVHASRGGAPSNFWENGVFAASTSH